jgi:hypothetical protein
VLVQRSGLADAESLSAPAKKAFAALDATQGPDEEEL